MNDSGPPEVLFLAHRFPYPPDKGDRIRTFHILQWLSRHARVHLACLADEPFEMESLKQLKCICERVEVCSLGKYSSRVRMAASLARGMTASVGAFQSAALKKTVASWARQRGYVAAMASSSALAHYLRIPELQRTRTVIDLVDVDSQKWLDYAGKTLGPRRWLYHMEGKRLRRLECELSGWTKAVVLVSEAETQLYRSFSGAERAYTIPNGVDLEGFQFKERPGSQESGCVFIGALDYYPNVLAACWFCRQVWPEIHERNPQATISLVGRRPAPEVRRLSTIPGVNVVGQVADVRPFLAAAAVVVVPLKLARGVQNKVLEALAMGKATVASPQSLVGLQANGTPPVLTASDPSEWVDAVIHLLDDEVDRRRLGIEGRRFVESHHRWEQCLEPLCAILDLPGRTGGGIGNRVQAGLTPTSL